MNKSNKLAFFLFYAILVIGHDIMRLGLTNNIE